MQRRAAFKSQCIAIVTLSSYCYVSGYAVCER